MNKETLKKAMQLQNEIENIQQALNSLNEKNFLSIREKQDGLYDARYVFIADVDDELKEIIKDHLIAKKEKLEKELAQTSYLDVLHQEMLERELERLKKIASETEPTKNE